MSRLFRVISRGAAGVTGAAGDDGLTSRRTFPTALSTLSTAGASPGVLIGAAIEKAAQAKVVRTESDGKYIFCFFERTGRTTVWDQKNVGCAQAGVRGWKRAD